MTAPIPKTTEPNKPFSAALRKELAAYIIANWDSTGWSKPNKATVQAVANDGGNHGMNDDALWLNYFLAGTAGTVPTPGVDQLNTISQFIARLSDGKLWTRVAEFGVGAIFLGIGLNALFKGKPAQYAKTAAKGAALL